MREVEGVPADGDGGALDGRFGLRAPRRRRALLVAMLALVAAGGAVAAVAGPGLTMSPASSVTRGAGSGSGHPGRPASTAAALALALATAGPTAGPTSGPAPTAAPTTGGAPTAAPTTDPTGAPTPGGHAPTAPPAPVPCNASGTSGSTVRPCPPPPCMEPMAAPPSPAEPGRDCPPPPCRWTMAGSEPVIAGPCPPPCNAASVAPSPTVSPSYVRACPPPPCEATPAPAGPGAMAPRPTCPPWPGTVVLTAQDSGRTITVHAGTRILVRLSGGAVWTEPMTSDGSVVTRISSSHDAQGDAAGDFRAAHAGNADLTATAGPRCAPQCKAMSRLWVVHVVVVA
jgi:hypothetical protein